MKFKAKMLENLNLLGSEDHLELRENSVILRQLGINEKATQSSLAKLSSGLRINTAADDAAGLAISEKMRGQISGLNKATSNAQDGISLVGTAEGALNETTSILQRMRELAVQGSNDTATTSDRSAMQTEVGQLKTEIDRIANTTQFNTKNLLDGSVSGAKTAQGTILDSVALKTGGSAVTSVAASTTMLQSLQDSTGNNLGLHGGDTINIAGIKNGSAISTTFTVAGITTTSDTTNTNDGSDKIKTSIAATDSLTFNYNGASYTVAYGATATASTDTLATVATQLTTQIQTAIGSTDVTVTTAGAVGAKTLVFGSATNKDVQITGSTNTGLAAGLVTNGVQATTTHLDSLLTQVSTMTGIGSTAAINGSGQIQINGVNGTANALSNVQLSATNRTLFSSVALSYDGFCQQKDVPNNYS